MSVTILKLPLPRANKARIKFLGNNNQKASLTPLAKAITKTQKLALIFNPFPE